MASPDPISRPPLDDEHPWPGPDYFEKDESHFFHGRQDEALDLVRALKRGPLTVLVGRSGVGKSSLVRAGLSEGAERERWVPVYLRLAYGAKDDRAIDQVFQGLERARVAGGLDGPQRQPGETLWEYFHREGAGWFTPDQCLVLPLLVFDQFEEIFALDRNNLRAAEEAAEVWRQLGDLLENRVPTSVALARRSPAEFTIQRSLFKVLVCIRQDYLADLMDRRGQMPSVVHNHLMLSVFDGHRAIEAVLRPGAALLAGETAREKEELAHEIVRRVRRDAQVPQVPQAASAPAAETTETTTWTSEELSLDRMRIEPALLSLFCQQLNEARIGSATGTPGSPARITRDLLKDQGGRIFERFYEESFQQITPPSLAEATRDFIEQKLIGRTPQGVDRRDSVSHALIEESMREAIRFLVDKHRLLRVTGDEDARVELIHDRLVPVVRASLERRERERKVRLDQIAWEQEREEVRKREQEQLDQKYKELRLQAEKARTRLLVQWLCGAMIAVVVLSGAGWFLYRKTVDLNEGIKQVEAGNRDLTLEKLDLNAKALELGAQTQELSSQTQELSSQRRQFLGRWAANLIDQRKFIEAQHVLLWAREQHVEVPHAQLLNWLIPDLVAEPYGRLDQSFSKPRQVALLSSGNELLVLQGKNELQWRDFAGKTNSLTESVDEFALGGTGERVVVVSSRKAGIQLWDRQESLPRWRSVLAPEWGTPGKAGTLPASYPSDYATAAFALSSDGQKLAVLYLGRGIALTTNLLGEDPPRLRWLERFEDPGKAESSSTNPSPSRKFSLEKLGTQPDLVIQRLGVLTNASSLAFGDRDAELILGSGTNGFGAFRYRLDGSNEILRIPVRWGESVGGELRPFVVSADGLQAAAGESTGPNGSSWAPIRRLWFLGRQDGGEGEWALADTPQAGVSALAFSPRGDWLAAGQTDGSVDLLHRGRRVQRLHAHSGEVSAVGFSSDGRYLLSMGRPFAKVWVIEPGKERWIQNSSESRGVAFSPDGEHVLQGVKTDSASSRMVRFATRDLEWEDPKEEWSLGFLADGRRFGVLKNSRGLACVLPDRKPLFDLSRIKGPVEDPLAFSARGDWFACAADSVDAIRIWFREAPEEQRIPLGWPVNDDESELAGMVGSASGERLAVSRASGAMAVISVRTRQVIARLRCPPSASSQIEFGPGEDYLSWSDPEDPRAIAIVGLDGEVVSRFTGERSVARLAVHEPTARMAVEDVDGNLALLTSFSVTNRDEFIRRTAHDHPPSMQSNPFPLELEPVAGDQERSVFPARTNLPLDRFVAELGVAERMVAANLRAHLARPDPKFSRAALFQDLAPFIALWEQRADQAVGDSGTRRLNKAWQVLVTATSTSPVSDVPAYLDLALQVHPVVAATLGVEILFPQLSATRTNEIGSNKRRELVDLLVNQVGIPKSGAIADWEQGIFEALARGGLRWDDLGFSLQMRAIDPLLDPVFLGAEPVTRLQRGVQMLDLSGTISRGVDEILAAFQAGSWAVDLYVALDRSLGSSIPRGTTDEFRRRLETPGLTAAERSILWTFLGRSGSSLAVEDDRLSALREAARLNTNNASAWRGLTQSLRSRARVGEAREQTEAWEALLRLLPVQSGDVMARFQLAEAQVLAGRFEDALTNLDVAAAETNRLATTAFPISALRADALMNLGRTNDAMAAYDQAVSEAEQGNPNNAVAVRVQRSYALMAQGQTNAALAAARIPTPFDSGPACAEAELRLVARVRATNQEDIVRKVVARSDTPFDQYGLGRSTVFYRLGVLQAVAGLREGATNAWQRALQRWGTTSSGGTPSARAAILLNNLQTAKQLLWAGNDEPSPAVQLAWAELESVRAQSGDASAENRMWLRLSKAATGDFKAWIALLSSLALERWKEDVRFQELAAVMRLPAGTPGRWVELARWQCRFAASPALEGDEPSRNQLLDEAVAGIARAREYGLGDVTSALAGPEFNAIRDRVEPR